MAYDWVKVANLKGPPSKILWLTASGTYTPTTGVRAILVECVGGGGGSGGASSLAAGQCAAGSGGGGGGYAAKYVTGTLKSSYPISIGAGGAKGVAQGGAVGNGGDTSFDSPVICLAKGGGGGSYMVSGTTIITSPGGPGGGMGSGNIGDFTIPGSWGGDGARESGTIAYAGTGGTPAGGMSPSNVWRASALAGVPGIGYGTGATGGYGWNGVGNDGANGAPGIIRITEYF